MADRQRYEATLDGRAAGFAAYEDGPDGVRVLTHTEVDPASEGRGVGGDLARAALDDIRGRGWRVDPQCPFVAGWIDRHPDYADLVASPS